MENQRVTPEQQECRKATVKLLKILEESLFDEALLLSCAMIAQLLRSTKVEAGTDRFEQFFLGFRAMVADQMETLDAVLKKLKVSTDEGSRACPEEKGARI